MTSLKPTPLAISVPPASLSPIYCEVDGLVVDVEPSALTEAGFFGRTAEPPELDAAIDVFLRSGAGGAVLRGVVVAVVSCDQAAAEGIRPGFSAVFTAMSDSIRSFVRRTVEVAAPVAHPVADSTGAEPSEGSERPSPSPDAASTLAWLETELDRIGRSSPRNVLGVREAATVAEAKEAFLRAARHSHPHVFARHKDPEVTRLATEIFIKYKAASDEICRGIQQAASLRPDPASLRPGAGSLLPKGKGGRAENKRG